MYVFLASTSVQDAPESQTLISARLCYQLLVLMHEQRVLRPQAMSMIGMAMIARVNMFRQIIRVTTSGGRSDDHLCTVITVLLHACNGLFLTFKQPHWSSCSQISSRNDPVHDYNLARYKYRLHFLTDHQDETWGKSYLITLSSLSLSRIRGGRKVLRFPRSVPSSITGCHSQLAGSAA
jgi:hypothetical protein